MVYSKAICSIYLYDYVYENYRIGICIKRKNAWKLYDITEWKSEMFKINHFTGLTKSIVTLAVNHMQSIKCHLQKDKQFYNNNHGIGTYQICLWWPHTFHRSSVVLGDHRNNPWQRGTRPSQNLDNLGGFHLSYLALRTEKLNKFIKIFKKKHTDPEERWFLLMSRTWVGFFFLRIILQCIAFLYLNFTEIDNSTEADYHSALKYNATNFACQTSMMLLIYFINNRNKVWCDIIVNFL